MRKRSVEPCCLDPRFSIDDSGSMEDPLRAPSDPKYSGSSAM